MVGLHSGTNIRISQCVTFLISEGAALTSVHGLVFAYETAPELFESGYTYVSLDVRDMMHRDLEDKERRLRHPYLNIPHERFNREKRIGHALIEKYGPLTRLLLMKVLAS